jgi:hypothetical protein
MQRIVCRKDVRTKEQVIKDLSTSSEHCDQVEARRVFLGLPKKSRWYAEEDIKGKIKDVGSRFRRDMMLQTQLVRWFSGKRYGISLDSDITSVLADIDVDLSGLHIELPWSPMLVKSGETEFFMWKNGETPFFTRFTRTENGTLAIYKGESGASQFEMLPVEHNKEAIAAWLCSVSKGEGKSDYFELKVGAATVALLPKINASTITLKHKIASDSEADRGSWVRKGHFRMTKSGPTWIPGVVCREELPFVHKVHELKPKGMLPESQKLFSG